MINLNTNKKTPNLQVFYLRQQHYILNSSDEIGIYCNITNSKSTTSNSYFENIFIPT